MPQTPPDAIDLDAIESWELLYAAYDQYLDYNESVEIDGVSLTPSTTLKTMSPVDYQVLVQQWADQQGIDTDELDGVPNVV